jgi:curli biogenesis system outer membrane secretion channel CsgG
MASKAHPGIGVGLKEMFLAVSSSSNHFKILNQGNPQEANPSPDLIINVAVTDFEPQASGGSAGTGGGGGVNSGVLGGLLGATLNKAHIALDIRVTDAATAQIVAQGRVQGQATDISGAVMAGSFSGWALGSNLFAYANTPMEKAIRICIFEAVRYITRSIPEKYYKY